MASQQALKEDHFVQTLSAKEFTYAAKEGGWIQPSDDHPTAKLPSALAFWVNGKVNYQLQKLDSVTVEFDISIDAGTPTLKGAHAAIGFRLGYDHDYTYSIVQDQIDRMQPNTRTTIKATFPVKATEPHGKTLNFQFLQTYPPKIVGGLTVYGGKIDESGKE